MRVRLDDRAVTKGSPCRTWDVYVATLMLGAVNLTSLPRWVSRDASVSVSAGKACLSELASEPRHHGVVMLAHALAIQVDCMMRGGALLRQEP